MKSSDSSHRPAMSAPAGVSRRTLVVGVPFVLAACQTTTQQQSVSAASLPPVDPVYLSMYAAMPEERFPIPAVDVTKVDPRYLRQEVADPTGERAGTIVVDTAGPFLYLVSENGRALRYGVGVGRAGFAWSGRAKILMKREWPTWTPPAEMIEREPKLERYRYGMEPGLDNPLGARALYLFEGGRDTLYRIHGTNEAWSIGKAVSSGCIRLFNQDAIDLYGRVPKGSEVVVMEHGRLRVA